MSSPLSHPSVFLSYSSADWELAISVKEFLLSLGLIVRTLQDLEFGMILRQEIEKAIRDADALIVLDSSYMRSSDLARTGLVWKGFPPPKVEHDRSFSKQWGSDRALPF
jgi:hypothetical protein